MLFAFFDPDPLHHALVFVVQEVAVHDKIAYVTLVAASDDGVLAGGHEHDVFPDGWTDLTVTVFHDLEGVDVDVVGMAGQV